MKAKLTGRSTHRLARCAALAAALALLAMLGQPRLAAAAGEVFLSNDVALSEVTYVVQFDTTVAGKIGKIGAVLPSGSNAGNARLGRLTIADAALQVERGDATLVVDPSSPDAVMVGVTVPKPVPAGSKIRLELFNLHNPPAGVHAIQASTFDQAGALLEVVPPISVTVFESGPGDITAVTAGSGLTGGGNTGDVTLSVDTTQIQKRVTGSCQSGSSIRAVDASGSVLCQTDADSGGTVVSVGTGSGLTGGPITSSGTISIPVGGVTSAHILDGTIGSVDVDSAQIQLRVTGSCLSGQAIAAVNADGTVACQSPPSGVTKVTASAPLFSSGGSSPNISLPDVFIGASTAIGEGALLRSTGIHNTATGLDALALNTTGIENTAAGAFALLSNTTGSSNTAVGDTALQSNTTGSNNTAVGTFANVASGDLQNATAIGAGAIVNASNKIRLGNAAVTVIEGQVGFTASSDRTKKENFEPVDGEAVLQKLGGLSLTSWNFIGHDPKKFRHYGPMAQDFFAAFGHDGIGTIGTPTTITSTDMDGILMIAAQTLDRRSAQQRREIDDLKARVEALERLLNSRTHASASAGAPGSVTHAER